MTATVSEDALHGDLHEFPLDALLHTLESSRRTGVLRIEGGSDVWFSDGRTYLVTSPSGAPIASVLYGAGAGGADDLHTMLQPGVGHSALHHILARKPGIEERLRVLLHEYMLNGLFELLVPSHRRFTFDPGRYHPLGDELAENTSALLEQARQRLDVWRRIAGRIPSTSARFAMVIELPDGARERRVSADDWRYLALANGTRTVADLIEDLGETPFRVCSVLYRLLLEGLIVELPGTVPSSSRAGNRSATTASVR